MKNLSFLPGLLTVLFITAGCSQRSVPIASHPIPVAHAEAQAYQPPVIYDDIDQMSDTVIVADIAEFEPVIQGIYDPATALPHNLTEAESQHVRSTAYDPFPDGKNKFTIDLNKAQAEFCFPYPGKLISAYGMRGRSMHSGSDIKGAPRDTIRSAFAGVVRLTKPYSGYGNVIVVRHANGLETVYAHNSKNLVRVGQQVKAGEAIGLIGRTGRATTEHLHFEVRIYGQHINPATLLDFSNQCLRDGTLTVTRSGTKILASVRRNDGQTIESEPRTVPAAPDLSKTTVTASNGASSTASSAQKTAATTARYHTIVKGDTLSALAKRYKTTVPNICKLSGISESTLLKLGKKLRVN